MMMNGFPFHTGIGNLTDNVGVVLHSPAFYGVKFGGNPVAFAAGVSPQFLPVYPYGQLFCTTAHSHLRK